MKLPNKIITGDKGIAGQRGGINGIGLPPFIVLFLSIFIFFPASPSLAQMVYVGNNLSTNGMADSNSIPPLVILGEYSPSGPLSNSTVSLPAGIVQDVKFYGANYQFTLYALAWVTNDPFNNEQTFQIVAEESFTNYFATGAITNILPVTNFTVYAGDFLAFWGTGPYYPQETNDTINSDATYQDPFYTDFGPATPPDGPGSQFTVGTYLDFNATYGYVPDTLGNQGRAYAFGVDCLSTNGYSFFTLAGRGTVNGSTDGLGTNALFNNALGTAVASNFDIYVADSGNNRIREVTTLETNWLVTTIAGSNGFGSADGFGTNAQFWSPEGIAVTSNETVFVSDTLNDTIRMLTQTNNSWLVRTIAGLANTAGTNDGSNSIARFDAPEGIAVDSKTNIYVADTTNDIIRKITLVKTNWVVTTIAGLAQTPGNVDATNSMARFNLPEGIAVDHSDNLFVADTGNNKIRKITQNGNIWTVSSIAGGTNGSADGDGANAEFKAPGGITVDAFDDLFVSDSGNDTIRSIVPVGTDWLVYTIGGVALTNGYADGTGPDARFTSPRGISVNGLGNLFLDEDVIVGGLSPMTGVKSATYNVEVVLGPQSADNDSAGWQITGESWYAKGSLTAPLQMQSSASLPIDLDFNPISTWTPPSGLASAVTNISQSATEFIAVNELTYTLANPLLVISNDKSLWITGATNTAYFIQYSTNVMKNAWKSIGMTTWNTGPLMPGTNYITNWPPPAPSPAGKWPQVYYRAQWTGQ